MSNVFRYRWKREWDITHRFVDFVWFKCFKHSAIWMGLLVLIKINPFWFSFLFFVFCFLFLSCCSFCSLGGSWNVTFLYVERRRGFTVCLRRCRFDVPWYFDPCRRLSFFRSRGNMGCKSPWKSSTYSSKSLYILLTDGIFLTNIKFASWVTWWLCIFLKVGFTTMSSAEALKAGLRGKALRITHYYRDFLWYI